MTQASINLGELVKIRTGKLDANAAVEGGQYPFFTCARDISWINTPAFDADAVLVAGNGDLNIKHYVGKFNAYQRTYVLENAAPKYLDMRFLFHFMDRYVETLRRQSIGGVIKYIKLGNLTNAPFPIVPIEEQRRISAMLDKADAIRRKHEQALTLADQYLRATFLEMFGDPVTNQRSLPEVVLEDMCQVISDCLHTTPKHFSEPSIYPSIRSSELQDGFIDLSSAKYVTETEYSIRIQRHMPVAGDVIYCREGARYGNVGLVTDGMTPCLGQRTMLFQAKSGLVTPEYLWGVLCSGATYHQAVLAAGGAASPHVNIKDIRKFACLLPPWEKQIEYSKICQKSLTQRQRLETEICEANDLFASLSQRAFRGEL